MVEEAVVHVRGIQPRPSTKLPCPTHHLSQDGWVGLSMQASESSIYRSAAGRIKNALPGSGQPKWRLSQAEQGYLQSPAEKMKALQPCHL